MPLTKLIMAMIKHGTKINKIAQAMRIIMNHSKTPTTRIPKKAMLILYTFYELIAIILKRPNIITSFANNNDCDDY